MSACASLDDAAAAVLFHSISFHSSLPLSLFLSLSVSLPLSLSPSLHMSAIDASKPVTDEMEGETNTQHRVAAEEHCFAPRSAAVFIDSLLLLARLQAR